MSILVDQDTRIIIQGITGREAASMSQEMLNYGANVVAGITPGKEGESIHGIPVYDTVKDALGDYPAHASIVSVPAPFARDAVMESADAGIDLIVVLTERVPKRDVIEMVSFARERGTMIIGPNSPGLISPGKTRLGYLGGSNPERAFRQGSVGIVSRSGGMTTELANLISSSNMGVSTAIGMGGDPVVGSTYIDFLSLYQEDETTSAVVFFCEPGGTKEEAAAEYIKETFSKPVVVVFGGSFVDDMPGTRFGHASVIVRPGSGTTREKRRKFLDAGVTVVDHYSEIPRALQSSL